MNDREIKYLILHKSDTFQENVFTENLQLFFLAPDTSKPGVVWYKGVRYNNLADLPDEYLTAKYAFNGQTKTYQVSIKKIPFSGRGWKTGGYHEIIEPSGKAVTCYADNTVTNGVILFQKDKLIISNFNSIHFCYIGGHGNTDNRTQAQKETLKKLVKIKITEYPDIKILGHNQVNKLTLANTPNLCPSFWVPDWLAEIGIPEKNIYPDDNFDYKKLLIKKALI